MRYAPFFPVGVAALLGACNDSVVGPDTADLLRGASSRSSLAATQTAEGLWERRIEYDWTARRYVKEIHVDTDMRLLPETDRVELLPGETAWVTWQVEAFRRLASDEVIEGVRGETCVTNTGQHRIAGFSVLEQVMVKNGESVVPVAGASVVIRSETALDPGATRCVPYEVLFNAEPGRVYKVVAGVAALSDSRRMTTVWAEFALPHEQATLEVDVDAWMRDGAYDGCDKTLGPDFYCLSNDGLPRDQRMHPPTLTTQPGMSFMVDIVNPGVCGQTFVYTIDEPLREGGPNPPGGEIRDVSGSLIITTGDCPPPGSGICVQTEEWWRTHYGEGADPDSVTQYLSIFLGMPHAPKTLIVPPSIDVVRWVFARAGVTNPIGELYAQLFAAKLNIARGSNPVPLRETRIAADVFLSTHRPEDWDTLTPSQQRAVEQWVAVLIEYNAGRLGPGACNGSPPPPPPPPVNGCTRTIGYWKNHAGFGPQADLVTPLLPVWLGTAGGAKTIQVTTAALAVSLLDRSGDASNGINKLYAQLLAARLNIKNGADGSAVLQTLTWADAFLASHAAADWSALSSTQRQQVLAWMSTLDDYNNGRLGPGHCN